MLLNHAKYYCYVTVSITTSSSAG